MKPPVFIIGSPRSGTKIFRDTLGRHPEIKVSPHPLEAIWSRYLKHIPHHEYSKRELTEKIKGTLRSEFAERSNGLTFLEKNVIHSLRVPFVHSVFPEAKFIHLVRDGRDVALSLRKRWKNPIDWNYYFLGGNLFRIPLWEGMRVFLKEMKNFLSRLQPPYDRVEIWGPQFRNIRDVFDEFPLHQACAIQWSRCVSRARLSGRKQDEINYHEVHYENLMKSPNNTLKKLKGFLSLESIRSLTNFAENKFHTKRIDRWKKEFTNKEIRDIECLIQDELRTFGYTNILIS